MIDINQSINTDVFVNTNAHIRESISRESISVSLTQTNTKVFLVILYLVNTTVSPTCCLQVETCIYRTQIFISQQITVYCFRESHNVIRLYSICCECWMWSKISELNVYRLVYSSKLHLRCLIIYLLHVEMKLTALFCLLGGLSQNGQLHNWQM